MVIPAPARAARLARALWIAWAVVVWHVVFDLVIATAGRRVVAAAALAAGSGSFVNIDAWMRPAAARGLWMATTAASAILLVGLTAIHLTPRPQQP